MRPACNFCLILSTLDTSVLHWESKSFFDIQIFLQISTSNWDLGGGKTILDLDLLERVVEILGEFFFFLLNSQEWVEKGFHPSRHWDVLYWTRRLSDNGPLEVREYAHTRIMNLSPSGRLHHHSHDAAFVVLNSYQSFMVCVEYFVQSIEISLACVMMALAKVRLICLFVTSCFPITLWYNSKICYTHIGLWAYLNPCFSTLRPNNCSISHINTSIFFNCGGSHPLSLNPYS